MSRHRAVLYNPDAESHALPTSLRRTCLTCRVTGGYFIPRSFGECVACADDEWKDAA